MNSKERVARVLKGEPVDRIPIGFFAIDADTVERILGRPTFLRAKAKSQIAIWEGRRDEVVASWKQDFIDLYRRLDFLDVVPICNAAGGVAPPRGHRPEAPRRIDEKTWEFKDGRVYVYSEVTQDLTMAHDPRKWTRVFSEQNFDLVAAAQPPQPPDPSVFEFVDAAIQALGPERYILGPSGGEVAMVELGGMERGLMEFAENPDLVRLATEYEVLKAEARDPMYLRPGVDGVLWGQDFSFRNGPMISPKMFREICLPAIQRRVRRIKEQFGKTVFKHACGNNWLLLDMFVEAGYDVYQSIQVSADMELERVKKAVGDRLTLWGGVQVETLMSGTPQDVKQEVDHAFQVLAPGGRFIFSTSHSVAVGTRYENFMAMIERYLQLRDRGA